MTSKPTETELLPCPFCGRLPAMKRVPSKSQSAFYWWVGCEIAGTPAKDLVGCGIGHSAWSEPEAAAKWNTRTPSPPPSSAEAQEQADAIVGSCIVDTDRAPSGRVYITVAQDTLIDRIASAISTPQPTLSDAVQAESDAYAQGYQDGSVSQPTLQQAIECVKKLLNEHEQRSFAEFGNQRLIEKATTDAYNAALAALSSLASTQENGGWLPIESAPKDGRTLLLGYPNGLGNWRTVRGQWFTNEEIGEWENGEDFEAGWYETSVENDEPPNCWGISPTHWMPLPSPPKEQQ